MDGLVDTKNEYIEHLQDILSVPIAKRIYKIYNECIDNKKSLKEFQTELVSIKKWNNNTVKEEYKNILKETKCKYFDNLIKIIIITSVKIKIYEYKDFFDNIKIKIPEPEDFLHKCYINVSLYCWKNAYLFNKKNIRDSELQNNLNIIEENIRYIIKKTFRDFIPINDILEQIQNNLTNNVQQFSEAPKKPIKENKSKKEEPEDVSNDSSEEETTTEEASEDSDGESEEASSDEESGKSEESAESDEEKEGSIEYNSGDESGDKKITIENEPLHAKEVINETDIIKEKEEDVKEPQNIIEEFTKEEEQSNNINIKNKEDYKEEEILSQNPIETSIVNVEDFEEDVVFNKDNISENIYNEQTEKSGVTDIEGHTNIANDNIKHVSIELPISNKPKKLSFF
jgi:hypothetical protein